VINNYFNDNLLNHTVRRNTCSYEYRVYILPTNTGCRVTTKQQLNMKNMANTCNNSKLHFTLTATCREYTSQTATSKPAITGKPRCSVYKLWSKYKCEKRASNLALSYGVDVYK